MLTCFFWILIAIIGYAYLGYTILLVLLNLPNRFFSQTDKHKDSPQGLPEVTLLIAAYNERKCIESKMENTLSLEYPKEKLKILWVTDGSDDGSAEWLKKYPEVTVLHTNERRGKTAALNRAMQYVTSPFVVFCDANTLLNREAVGILMRPFRDPRTGCVAGEKRIDPAYSSIAASTGEGAYWKYESWIKKLESDLNSTLGAAGELYAIRTHLYQQIPTDIILDDLVNSLHIAFKKYKIKYEPDASALEAPSRSIREELKRKIRIASGGFQTIARYPSVFNFFRHPLLSFEFISHKLLRWAVVPFALPSLLIINLLICMTGSWSEWIYNLSFFLQLSFYFLALIGAFFEQRAIRIKILFLPLYLCIMNFAQMKGFIRFIRKTHSVVWEKAGRMERKC